MSARAWHTRPWRVVAIFFWGRSGSVFLHSLFDSHPEVLTFPATRLNAFHSRQWQELQQRSTLSEMIRCFCDWNPSVFDGREDRWFEGLDRLGPGRDQPLFVDRERFARELTTLLEGRGGVSRREFFIAAHLAYALARGEDLSQKTTIVYHMHSPEAYAAIEGALQDFPGMRAIGVTREPVRSTLSYLRKNVLAARAWGHADRSKYDQLASTGAYNFVYRHQLIGWRELLARYQVPFRAVRIEDLNRDLEGEMRLLASELGLRWHPCLTASTFGGLAYHGDQLSIGAVGPAAPPPSTAESDGALDALDRFVLEALLAGFREEFGYGEPTAFERWLAPVLVLLPTHVERLELAAALRGLSRGLDRAEARRVVLTLRRMLERQGFSYRHLVCEWFPWLRALLPVPAPLSSGLVLPKRAA